MYLCCIRILGPAYYVDPSDQALRRCYCFVAVLVRPDFQNVRELQRAMIQLASNPDVREALFNETNNPEGYVFQSSVESFIPIESSTPAYLGAAGRAIQGVANLRASPVEPLGASTAGR